MTTGKQTSIFENGLIWFGAGVSIAEILTGTYFASLGFGKALAAILLGHLIGCTLLFLSGVIGGKQRLSAMESVKGSFGQNGGRFFALMNVLQLLGWTAIMIYDGALAANNIFAAGHWLWCLIIGALIVLWILIGITNLGKINTVAMTALFLLTAVLCKVIFFDGTFAPAASDGSLSFGAAVEPAVAMPFLAAFDQRLHPGGSEACQGRSLQRRDLRCGQLLDVRHRNGRRPLYRGK